MGDLSNHFGEDASLGDAVRQEIEDYLTANAADANGVPRYLASLPKEQWPIRITEMPWFTAEHGSRLAARAKSNASIGSISNCNGCHSGAEQGFFDDD